MHSVFQMYPNSRIISIKDVRDAINKTSRMRPYQRLRYFHDNGMHFSRCVKYINIVENLEALYATDTELPKMIEMPKHDHTVTIVDTTDKKMSIQDIGKIIDELLKEFDAD